MTAYILQKHHAGVTTLIMNRPKRLNGWTMPMMDALKEAIQQADEDPAVSAIVLTGTDPYYSAGVHLGGTLTLAHPRKLHADIVAHNQALFDVFLDCETPILAAINGPAIGACVTSATLCNAIVASENATFSTPFSRLGIPPEGCSSVLFPRLLGDDAQRMLGEEGWTPTAEEARAAGLVQWVVPHDQLLQRAQDIAQQWVQDGVTRQFPGGFQRDELKAVNAEESLRLATAFLSPPFLMGQFRFLWGRRKRGLALLFLLLRWMHPLWRHLL